MSYSRQRWSARLAGEKPEITEEETDCFFCLIKVDQYKPSTVRLPCCNKFTHRSCQKEWEKNVRSCAHCRSDLPEQEEDDADEVLPPPEGVPQEIRDQLAQRLRNKLNDPVILERVRQFDVNTVDMQSFVDDTTDYIRETREVRVEGRGVPDMRYDPNTRNALHAFFVRFTSGQNVRCDGGNLH